MTLALRTLSQALTKGNGKLSQEENFKSSGKETNEHAIYTPNETHAKESWHEARSLHRKAEHEKDQRNKIKSLKLHTQK